MVYTDKMIKGLISSNVLCHADESCVTNIAYDLRTEHFFVKEGTYAQAYDLMPGESVFVSSIENIKLPNNLFACVCLRNKRIRQGLELTAPIYQPGHETKIFFRITNVSKNLIQLSREDGIAYIMFEQLPEPVEKPYDGAAQLEFDFRGIGQYEGNVKNEIVEIEKKVDDIRHIEKNMYGNVITLMTVFIGIFSLINVNVNLALTSVATLKNLIVFNLSTIGSIAFMAAIINTVLPNGDTKPKKVALWSATVIAILLSICVLVFG